MIASRDLADAAVAAAGGLDGCIALVRESSDANLRWARNTLTTTGESRARDLTLVGFRNGPAGTATATVSLGAPEVHHLLDLVGRLAASLAGAPPAEDASPLVAGGDDGDWPDSASQTDGSVFSAAVVDLGEMFGSAIARDVELFGYAEHSVHATWLASSTGLRRHHAQPQGRLEITAKSHARSRSAWWGAATDTFDDIDWDDAEGSLAQSLEWQARVWDVPPGRHRVLLTPGAVGDLMVDLWWSATAREAVEGRSVFSASGRDAGPGPAATRIGERLSPLPLTLASDAHDPLIPSAPFLAATTSSDHASAFDTGSPLGRVEWIGDGRLTALMAGRRFAEEHGLPFVASPDTIRLDVAGARGGLAELVRGVDEGLVVTCLWYNRVVDPQTLLL
ncbi:MAG: metallopeptidase TldD-related protein, partial [bacterium]